MREAIQSGKIKENYPEDKPYPSNLYLGWQRIGPLSVVVAENKEDHGKIIVTAYQPNPTRWANNFTRRKEHDMCDL